MAVGDGAVGEAGGSRDAEAAAAAAERTVPCVTGAVEHRSHGRREGRARHGSSHAKGLQRRAWHASGVLGAHHLLRTAGSASSHKLNSSPTAVLEKTGAFQAEPLKI